MKRKISYANPFVITDMLIPVAVRAFLNLSVVYCPAGLFAVECTLIIVGFLCLNGYLFGFVAGIILIVTLELAFDFIFACTSFATPFLLVTME